MSWRCAFAGRRVVPKGKETSRITLSGIALRHPGWTIERPSRVLKDFVAGQKRRLDSTPLNGAVSCLSKDFQLSL